MVKASSLTHVPLDPFADGEGVPFTLSSHTAAGYLSLKYPAWAIEATSSIGVSQLSPREFLGDLHSAITRDPTTFRTKSAIWHSQLARTLIKLSTDPELMSLIQNICLIPLHDGNWSSAKGQSLFFSKSETSLEIPSGIEVLIVDSTAESDPNRRTLFTSLGVKAWEAPEICRLVLKVHESSDFDPKSLTVDQLISHAAFLYKASWQPPKTADLWFATMQDERCMGRKLYIPGSIERNSPAARIFAQLQKRFAVIHGDYLKAFPADAEWPMWLVSSLGLSKVPRLITPQVDPKPQPTQSSEIPVSSIGNKVFQLETFDDEDDSYDYDPVDLELLGLAQHSEDSSQEMQEMEGNGTGPITLPSISDQLGEIRPVRTPLRFTPYPGPGSPPKSPNDTSRRELPSPSREHFLYPTQGQPRRVLGLSRSHSPTEAEDAPPSPTIWDEMEKSASNDTHDSHISIPRLDFGNSNSVHVKPGEERRAETAGEVTSKEIPEEITPSAPVSATGKKFALSEEFIFIFRECNSSDVLQLLKDNWRHYSQWIGGAHMDWQNSTFLQSSTHLKKTLGTCLVQSAKGPLPLQGTVLPMIDRQLDEGRHIPAVDIRDPQHPEWTLLSYFGVIMKGDVQYYLRCLISISEEHRPDVDSVAYIYEQIQARYRGNEELIRYFSHYREDELQH
jgi:hypothetical protein